MNTAIHLRNITHSENLETQLKSWAEEHLRVRDERSVKFDVYLSKAAARKNGRGPVFECHMTATVAGLGRAAFVKITDSDFWSAFTGCARKLRHQLQRRLERRQQRRTHAELL